MRARLIKADNKKRQARLHKTTLAEKVKLAAHMNEMSMTAEQAANKHNVFREYGALKAREDKLNNYDTARYLILRGIVKMVEYDPINADIKEDASEADQDYWRDVMDDIRRGGGLLYKEGGMSNMSGMHDDLVWSFIPKRFHRAIDHIWDGIGGWIN